jgi:hypothetical protein
MNLFIHVLRLTQLQWLLAIISISVKSYTGFNIKEIRIFQKSKFLPMHFIHMKHEFGTVCSHSSRLRPQHFIRASYS